VFKEEESAALNISLNTRGFVNTSSFEFRYQACNGGWIPLNNTDFTPGLQVTKLRTLLTNDYTYKLQVREQKLNRHIRTSFLSFFSSDESDVK